MKPTVRDRAVEAPLPAHEAWAALIKLGFADYSGELDRCEAVIRFIAFCEFYRLCAGI